MSEIKRCENCGNENIEIINRYKGHYLCGKCGRDTEKLYEIEHDAEIRAKAVDELCNEFRKDWEEQCENNMEDCINWYDWLLVSAELLKKGVAVDE